MKHDPNLSRRHFLRDLSCASLGSTAVFSTLLNLKMAGRAAAETTSVEPGYKSIVCLFLSGGNDSFNMLVPRGDNEYAEYASTRSNLALPKNGLLPITPTTSDGRSYGLHPSTAELKDLFDSGNLSFIANVGTLIERPDQSIVDSGQLAQSIRNGSYKLPLGIYSHIDQQANWQSAISDKRSGTGWAGRTADLIQCLNSNQNIGMGISLNGINVFQAGNESSLYAIDQNGSPALRNYRTSNLNAFSNAVNSLLDHDYAHLFQKQYADSTKSALGAQALFESATTSSPNFDGVFPGTNLGRDLRMISRTIAAQSRLGMERQTFFVRADGFDNHGDLLGPHATLMGDVSKAVKAFWESIKQLGMEDEVILFTVSDFARTLTSNGSGSDHAWGGNQFVVGGSALKGGDIFGDYPVLALGNNLDTGRGRLLPTTSVEEYFSELALWLGVQTSDLSAVFPNIGRFFTPGAQAPPLGFLNL